MAGYTRFVGLDVHANSIAVAVMDLDGTAHWLGNVANEPKNIRKLVKNIGPVDKVQFCYEAGPTGYGLYWQFAELGVDCKVVAPSRIPKKPGDLVKTDRRDAEKLARCLRNGDLDFVWVPDREHEALRDLVRARLAAKKDQRRARHRLQKLFLRYERRPPNGERAWTVKYMTWVEQQTFDEAPLQATLEDYRHEVEHMGQRLARLEKAIDTAIAAAPAEIRAVVEALQTLRGVAKLTAVSVVAELGKLSRFEKPTQLMSFTGVVPREYSTGGPGKASRGSITKTGNSHLRRLVTESAWSYRHAPRIGVELKKRQEGQSAKILEISWKAQTRLCGRYRRLLGRGKESPKVITAISRELLGFIWAIGVEAERSHTSTEAQA